MHFANCFLFNNICFLVRLSFFVRLSFLVPAFTLWLYFITYNCWIIHNTCYIFSIFTIICRRISNIIFFTCMTLFTLTLTVIIIPPLHFLPLNLNSHLHDICFANVFDSFIPVIMLNTFKFFVLFGTHTIFPLISAGFK